MSKLRWTPTHTQLRLKLPLPAASPFDGILGFSTSCTLNNSEGHCSLLPLCVWVWVCCHYTLSLAASWSAPGPPASPLPLETPSSNCSFCIDSRAIAELRSVKFFYLSCSFLPQDFSYFCFTQRFVCPASAFVSCQGQRQSVRERNDYCKSFRLTLVFHLKLMHLGIFRFGFSFSISHCHCHCHCHFHFPPFHPPSWRANKKVLMAIIHWP